MLYIEEVGNNRYRRHGHQETIYAPNIDTAKKKFYKQLKKELYVEIDVLERMLFHKGFKIGQQQLEEIKKIVNEMNDEK